MGDCRHWSADIYLEMAVARSTGGRDRGGASRSSSHCLAYATGTSTFRVRSLRFLGIGNTLAEQ